jgi:hypothetical protein
VGHASLPVSGEESMARGEHAAAGAQEMWEKTGWNGRAWWWLADVNAAWPGLIK